MKAAAPVPIYRSGKMYQIHGCADNISNRSSPEHQEGIPKYSLPYAGIGYTEGASPEDTLVLL